LVIVKKVAHRSFGPEAGYPDKRGTFSENHPMRTNVFSCLAVVSVAAVLVHCSSTPVGPVPVVEPIPTVDPKPDSGPGVDAAPFDASAEPKAPTTMAELYARLKVKSVKGQFDPKVGKQITANGISFTIVPDSVFEGPVCDDADPAAVLATGPIDFEATGLNTAGDMLRANRPTVVANGGLLESGGALELHVFSKNKELCVSRIKELKFKAPVTVAGSAPMSLWVADTSKDNPEWKVPFAGSPAPEPRCNTELACSRDPEKLACAQQRSCVPFLCATPGDQACRFDICVGTPACPAKPACVGVNVCSKDMGCIDSAECRIGCRGKCDKAECANAPTCRPVPVPAGGTAPDYFFNGSPFGSIGSYNAANCDRLMSLPGPKIMVKVPFGSNYSAQAGVFFIPATVNSAVKLYTKLATGDGFVSYANSMPVGLSGKLIALSLKDGKYYYEERTVTVADDGDGTQSLIVNPIELSLSAFEAKINAL
jgi:hypothetical protein